jgi:N-acyl homoserine lactone hydrolase
MPEKIAAHVLACGTMHCDLTWLLLQPGTAITNRANPGKPAEWITCPTHAVLVDHPEGRIMSHLHFDHAGNLRTFARNGTRLICNDKEYEFANGFDGAFKGAHLKSDYEGTNATMVFGHDPDQIGELRVAPQGSYT